MPFEKGHKKSGGRKKGVKNKESVPLEEKSKELGINPFEILLLFAQGDWQKLGYESQKIIKFGANGVENEEYIIPPSVRAKAASEACQYLYPKLKAIEHSGSIDREDKPYQVILTLPSNGSESTE